MPEYDFQIVYRKDTLNSNADALSQCISPLGRCTKHLDTAGCYSDYIKDE